MSLITRCPACGTMFKVVPDQLRISDGWVRCGHCAEVFDATANLQQDAPAVHAQAPEEAETTSEFPSSIHTEVGEVPGEDDPDSQELAAQARALREDPLDRPFELVRPDVSELPEPAASGWAAQPAEPEPEVHDLSFVRQARRKAFWRRPGVRAILALLFVVLAALLTLQVAMHDRDRLAASEPALRPWLAGMCDVLRCTLQAPRRIESIAIDNSSFNKLRADTYRLNVTLRNQAGFEVAVPALELTLTDGQDQAVVRRVILPSEIARGTAVIAAGADWSASVALAVDGNGSGSRIAGYRLLAFYP